MPMSRSLNINMFALTVCVLSFVLLTSADDCNPGFSSPGWIYPKGDVHIEVGKEVDMFCVLNDTHPDGNNNSWRNLSFLIDNVPVTSPMVEKYNETAIRLHWNQTVVSANDYYTVSCRLNQEIGICTRYLFVGYGPLRVTDFECTSYNWERLECVWKQPPNPILTNYTLSYQVPSSRRMSFLCPLKKKLDRQRTACSWTRQSNTPYIVNSPMFNFTMFMSNAMVPLARQYLGVVDHYAIMIPSAMESLRLVDSSSSSLSIAWNIPHNLQLFPSGLEYSVSYAILADWANSSQYHQVDTSGLSTKDPTLKIDVDVEFPFTNYQVMVKARSTAANRTNGRFWSQPAVITVQSLPNRPCKEPEIYAGSFLVSAGRSARTVTIHWSQMERQCENGADPGYAITMRPVFSGANSTRTRVIKGTETTWVDFGNVSAEEAYVVELTSLNAFNSSLNSSHILVPAASRMPSRVQNVMKMGYNATLFEVQWRQSRQGGVESEEPQLSNYTVFWCQSVRDHPVRCRGRLHAQVLDPSRTSVNITVPDGKSNYQFGVGANRHGDSSGIVWSDCIIDANRPDDSQIKKVDVTCVTSTTIDLSWSLPCNAQYGAITKFNVYYCAVDVDDGLKGNAHNADCLEMKKQVQIAEPGMNGCLVDNLEPFTLYKIFVSVETRVGEGEFSIPVFNRTAAGQPSSPVNLRLTDVSNETISVSWSVPLTPNGNSIFYKVFLNDAEPISNASTDITLKAESYTNYSVIVQACNSINLCSTNSRPLIGRTKIGVPSQVKGVPVMKLKPENSSLIMVSWLPAEKPGGPTYQYVIHVNSSDYENEFVIPGNELTWQINSADICIDDHQLSVRVRAVNRALDENEESILPGPWSPEGFFPCPTSGLALAYILLIAFGAAIFVLIVIALAFFSRRVHLEREKARDLSVRMPWETEIHLKPADGDSNSKMDSILKTKSKICGVNYQGNYYGLLKSKFSSNGMDDAVDNVGVSPLSLNKSISDKKMEIDGVLELQFSSSGNSSGPNSISSNQVSEMSSNSDSGAVSETDTTKSLNADPFVELMNIRPSPVKSELINKMENVVEPAQYSTMDTLNADSDPIHPHFNQIPESYVQIGTVHDIAGATSSGYVTVGEANGLNVSSGASPSLSVSSTDSLISKATRASSRMAAQQKKNVALSGDEEQNFLCASSAPGYVSFKNNEPVLCDKAYVTLGSIHADFPQASVNADKTDTFYV